MTSPEPKHLNKDVKYDTPQRKVQNLHQYDSDDGTPQIKGEHKEQDSQEKPASDQSRPSRQS